MRAGRLNRRVTLERESIERGRAGRAKRVYTPIATVWAAVRPLREREFTESQKKTAELLVEITIRYRADIRQNWRLQMDDRDRGTRFFGITGIVNPMDGRRELQLICRELQSGEPV